MKRSATLLALLAPGLCAAADLPELKARGTLRLIAAADEQPETFAFETAPGGAEPGFERELLEGFARLQGMRVEAVSAKSYSDRIPMLTSGQGDVIVAIFVTDERRKQIAFSDEVMPTHNVVVTIGGAAPVTSLEDLKSRKVGVVTGTASVEETLAAGVPPGNLVKVADGEAAVQALRDGSVGAIVRPISEFALTTRRIKGLKAGMVVGPPGSSAWGLRKEDAQLKKALDEYLANSRRASAWNRLLVKYFGDQVLEVLGRGSRAP
jgi:ABC-type amino acid transport substrate-binding protein